MSNLLKVSAFWIYLQWILTIPSNPHDKKRLARRKKIGFRRQIAVSDPDPVR
jgi:hypothetical protein